MKIAPTTARLRDGSDVRLRSPDHADARAALEFLRTLSCESWRYLNHPPGFYDSLTEEAEARFLAAAAEHPRSFVISAWHDDGIIGNADVMCSGGSFATHVGEVGLGILTAHRRRGLGHLLTSAVVSTACAAGVTNLILRVRTFNEPAIRLYERLGFIRVGTLRGVARLPEGIADEHVYQRLSAVPEPTPIELS